MPPQSIVYSNPIKESSDLLYAAAQGVPLTTADTIAELRKIIKFAPQMRVLWRIAIQEDNAAKLSTTFSGKFGDDLADVEQARARFAEIAALGINL